MALGAQSGEPTLPTVDESSLSLSEEESYREHLAALGATLFRASTPTLTFELESGSLNLISGSAGGDPPRK